MKISKNELIFIPLGGSGEIGMNCNLYHYEGSWIMIDLGVMFGNSSISPNELIMPNINFILENKIKLDALILLMHMKITLEQFHIFTINLEMFRYLLHHLQLQF